MDQTSASVSKPGTSKQTKNLDPTPPRPPPRTQPSSHMDEAMEVDLYGPPLSPCLRDDHCMHDSDPRHVSDQHSGQSEESSWVSARPKKHADKRKHKVRSRYLSQSSSAEEGQSSVHIQSSSKPSRALSDQDQPQHNPHPLFYREVAMADLPSQYAEEFETFRHIQKRPTGA